MSTRELMMSFYSVRRWNEPAIWNEYFAAMESILDDKLATLDVNDPARRKANVAKGEGEFVAHFGELEDGRWMWGKFAKTKIECSIQHYKAGVDSFGRLRNNAVKFHIPERMALGSGVDNLIRLFASTNAHLSVFYAYGDFADVISAKRPSTPSLDIARELLGVFWLTYFGPHYCDFFTRPRLLALDQATAGPAGGVTLRLAETPTQVSSESRASAESDLGELTFAGHGAEKAPGQYALTLADLATDTLGRD